jgi:hypothetical protein
MDIFAICGIAAFCAVPLSLLLANRTASGQPHGE